MLRLILSMCGLSPSKDEKAILQHLNSANSASMRVKGRGTLTMDPHAARSTKKSKEFIQSLDSLIK